MHMGNETSLQNAEPSAVKVWGTRIGIALVVIALVYGLGIALKGLFSGGAPHKKQVTTIKILPDTPPPPPPPPKEQPKEQPREQPKEIKMEQPKPQEAPQPPSEQLKMEGEAGDGPSVFDQGKVTKDYDGGDVATKPRIGFSKSASYYAFYTNQIRTQIEDALEKDKTLASGKYKVIVHLWLAKDGRLERFELAGSSGVPDTDERIKAALAQMPPVSEAPPEDMPQPVKMRITARSAG
jgi:TonB family protein